MNQNKIIAFTGKAGTGKSTAANYLHKYYNYRQLSFAGPLKDAVAATLGYPRNLLEGDTPESRAWREDPANAKYGRTPRQWLQHFGTEICRQQIHNEIWVNRVREEIQKGGNIVIPDTRFPNELAMLQAEGATIIHLTADGASVAPTHESELDPGALLEGVIHMANPMDDTLFTELQKYV